MVIAMKSKELNGWTLRVEKAPNWHPDEVFQADNLFSYFDKELQGMQWIRCSPLYKVPKVDCTLQYQRVLLSGRSGVQVASGTSDFNVREPCKNQSSLAFYFSLTFWAFVKSWKSYNSLICSKNSQFTIYKTILLFDIMLLDKV